MTFIDRSKDWQCLLKEINRILDRGFVFASLMSDIRESFRKSRSFPWHKYSRYNSNVDMDYRNILRSGTRYYHKNLLIMNSPSVISHDVDAGVLVSHQQDFYVEPRASYTMHELVSYFYERTGVDSNEADGNQFSRKRVSSFFKALLRTIDVDRLLFMIEAAGRSRDTYERTFTIRNFADFMPQAIEYIENIKENADSTIGGSNYVIKKRRLLPC